MPAQPRPSTPRPSTPRPSTPRASARLAVVVLVGLAAAVLPLVGPAGTALAAGSLPTGTVVTPGNLTTDPNAVNDPGTWYAPTEWPGLGSVAMDYTADYPGVSPAPSGLAAAVLATGPGDQVANHGGKPYLYITRARYAGQPVTSLADLGYDWTTVSAPAPGDRPYLSVEVADDANGSTGYMSWVYDPTWFGASNPAFGTWTSENPLTDTHGYWRPSRDVVDGSNNVLIAKNASANWSDLVAAAPSKVILGISWFVGQKAYNASTVDVTAMVDDVRLDMSSDTVGTQTFDLEYGIGDGDYSVDPATSTIDLAGDVTTSQTAYVYDGYTVHGNGHTLTAQSAAPWVGAVLRNDGTSMNIANLTVTGQNLGGACDAGDNRLMGIYFKDAGGTVTDTAINGITQGDGCQEGIALYIKATDGQPHAVTADHVSVHNFQKGGITVTGAGADLTLTNGDIGPAAAADGSSMASVIAANGLQVSYGATATVHGTTVAGNEWDGNDQWSSTGVLIYQAAGADFSGNTVNGADTDEGVYVSGSSNVTVTGNTIERTASPSDTLDVWGIGLDLSDGGNSNTLVGDNYFDGWNINSLGLDPLPAPTLTLSSSKPGQITASWGSGIDHTEAGPATSYLVGITPGTAAQQVAGTATSTTFSGLSRTTDYTVTLAGRNPAFNTRNSLYLTNPGVTPEVSASLLAAPVVSVKAKPHTVRFGTQVRIKGLVSASGLGLAGSSVAVYAKRHGASSFLKVATTSTNASGKWHVTVTPKVSTSYYALITSGGRQAAKTTTLAVAVQPRVTLAVTVRSRATAPATFKGQVRATGSKVRGSTVRIQQWRNGHWRTAATTKVGAHRHYSTRLSVSSSARTRWRAVFVGNAYYRAAHSHTVVVRPHR
jgi:hypothetical protein